MGIGDSQNLYTTTFRQPYFSLYSPSPPQSKPYADKYRNHSFGPRFGQRQSTQLILSRVRGDRFDVFSSMLLLGAL